MTFALKSDFFTSVDNSNAKATLLLWLRTKIVPFDAASQGLKLTFERDRPCFRI